VGQKANKKAGETGSAFVALRHLPFPMLSAIMNLMDRMVAFENLKEHPWLGRAWGKLSQEELSIARRFIREHSQADRAEFEFALNRLFLDLPKPKHHNLILDLLCNANSLAK
jgi:hypothetical protein